jgi:transcriptional regulator with XRE-family HTH domain
VKILPLFLKNLRRARLNAGLTQEGLAEKAKVAYKYYQNLEAGRLPGMTLATVERLAGVLGTDVWKLFHPSAVPAATRERVRKPRRKR